MPPRPVLAIDFGSQHTVAVLAVGGTRRVLLFDGTPLLESAVFAGVDGGYLVGRDAVRAGRHAPDRLEPFPKARLGEGSVLLGGTAHRDVALVAAVLSRVAKEAVRVAGQLPPAVLTCPAAWGASRRAALRAAAIEAGIPVDSIVDEPVAAAAYFVQALGGALPPGRPLAVFDLGAGTLDVALVRADPAGPVILASTGRDDLGGRDVDAAILTHLRATSGDGAAHPAAWAEVRAAKEALSRSSTAPVQLDPGATPTHLTRDEVERLARPIVAAASAATAEILRAQNLRPDRLAGLFLVGGATRMPLVAQMLHHDLGIPPTTLEQPETAVAEGAALLAQRTAEPVPPPPPVPVAAPRPDPTRPRSRRRLGIGAAALGLALLAALAVYLPTLGEDPDGQTPTQLGSGTSGQSSGAGSPSSTPSPFNAAVANWPETTVRLLDGADTECLTGEVSFLQGQAKRDNGQWMWKVSEGPDAINADFDGDGAVDAALRVDCAPYATGYTEDVWIISGKSGQPRLIAYVDLDGDRVQEWHAEGPVLIITAEDGFEPGKAVWTRSFAFGTAGQPMRQVAGA